MDLEDRTLVGVPTMAGQEDPEDITTEDRGAQVGTGDITMEEALEEAMGAQEGLGVGKCTQEKYLK